MLYLYVPESMLKSKTKVSCMHGYQFFYSQEAFDICCRVDITNGRGLSNEERCEFLPKSSKVFVVH